MLDKAVKFIQQKRLNYLRVIELLQTYEDIPLPIRLEFANQLTNVAKSPLPKVSFMGALWACIVRFNQLKQYL
jgi:hypothetical protein